MNSANTSTIHPARYDKRNVFKVWNVLVSVAVLAFGILVSVWLLVHPSKDTLWYEVAKTSLQILGVAVIGGIVSLATTSWQQDRKDAADALERQRKTDEEELELRREQFKLRAALLDRSSKYAQKMYVTCQHVRRVQADHENRAGNVSQVTYEKAVEQLDQSYLEFSAEAEALETELGARYCIRREDDQNGGPGEAFLRWHQISDLLTVYYFNLKGDFRKDILKRNSRQDDELHSGLDLASMVANPRAPSGAELSKMRNSIRPKFQAAMAKFAGAVLREQLMDTASTTIRDRANRYTDTASWRAR